MWDKMVNKLLNQITLLAGKGSTVSIRSKFKIWKSDDAGDQSAFI